MRTRPSDIDDSQLIAAVNHGWAEEIATLEYVAIGGGSHHWVAANGGGAKLWLSLDDLDDKPFLGTTRAATFEALRQALSTTQILHNAGLEFAVAPQPTRNGAILTRVQRRYALAVYPFLEGTAYRWGDTLPAVTRAELVELLIRLHQATPLAGAAARKVRVELAARGTLEAALRDTNRTWTSGPFAERARQVLSDHVDDARSMLHTFDGLVADLANRKNPPVISHGEPHPANLMRLDNRLLLLDWDTVGLAPPERDLWWLARDGSVGLERYSHATGNSLEPSALALYRLRWQLDDLIWCVRGLRAPHTESVEARRAWEALGRVVEIPEWMR